MTSPDEPVEIPGLGLRLREYRRRSGLTLEATAGRVGLSPAHLSRLETGRRQPSLPVLLVLARTFGVTVSDLLGEETGDREPVVRAADMEAVPSGGWTYWRAGGSGRAMQALRLHIPMEPRATGQDELVRVHPGEEWLYVTRGRLRLGLGERTHVLGAGDAAHFDSLVPHRISAASEEGVDLLFVHTLLQSAPATLCVGAHGSRA